MVWSQPDEPESQAPHSYISSRPSSSRIRPRRSSTSTVFTTTTGYTDTDNDTTTYTENPHQQHQQPTIPLAYPPSEATTATRTYTQPSQSHISPTPHPSEDYHQSQDLLIPSAQPTTPIFPPPTGPAFSISDEPSPLPSPPESLPSAPSSPAHSRRTSSYGSLGRWRRSSTLAPVKAGPQYQSQSQSNQHHQQTSPAATPRRGRARGRGRGRNRATNRDRPERRLSMDINRPTPTQPPAEESDAMDMSTLLEGIGRMHIAMNQDPAGRWRIKRHDWEYD